MNTTMDPVSGQSSHSETPVGSVAMRNRLLKVLSQLIENGATADEHKLEAVRLIMRLDGL